jgi:hypothetical protein
VLGDADAANSMIERIYGTTTSRREKRGEAAVFWRCGVAFKRDSRVFVCSLAFCSADVWVLYFKLNTCDDCC